ncbi:MAG: hypothetical protein ACREN4_03870 [Candidatus Dormibacteria bacterium]
MPSPPLLRPFRLARACCCSLPLGCCLVWVVLAGLLALLLAVRVLGRL